MKDMKLILESWREHLQEGDLIQGPWPQPPLDPEKAQDDPLAWRIKDFLITAAMRSALSEINRLILRSFAEDRIPDMKARLDDHMVNLEHDLEMSLMDLFGPLSEELAKIQEDREE